jgi:hypothetical protein
VACSLRAGRHLTVLDGSKAMTVVEDPRPGSRGGTRIPSPDDVLIAAIGLVLAAAAGLPEAAIPHNGHGTATGFLAARVAGAAHSRAAVTWYEDGKPSGAPDGPSGKLRDCERALRRAGFQVEYTGEITAGCLTVWRKGSF